MEISWETNVVYNPEKKAITFIKIPGEGNKIDSLLDYVREEYPEKSWLELLSMVLPQINTIAHPEELQFFST